MSRNNNRYPKRMGFENQSAVEIIPQPDTGMIIIPITKDEYLQLLRESVVLEHVRAYIDARNTDYLDVSPLRTILRFNSSAEPEKEDAK